VKGKYIGLSGKAWIGILAMGVVIFVYVRRKNAAAASATTDTTTTDPNASASLLSPALGGTPADGTGGFDTSWLASLFQQQTQSLEDFMASTATLAGSGISGAGGSGIAGSIPAQAAPAPGGSPIMVAAPNPGDNASVPVTTDVANPATSFFAPGTNDILAASAAPNPLYAYSGGSLIAESPIAGSVFSPYAPASSGYEALGVHASDPVTFVPAPMSTPTTSSWQGERPVRGTAVPV
jgi:hypothetical protein